MPSPSPIQSSPLDHSRYEAVRARDPESEGQFYYSVETTGVYCRPTCGARLPRPEHVRFHESPEAAERAGFRACKRCRPNEPERGRVLVDRARALLEGDAPIGGLAALAEGVGLSPHYLHRLFKKHVGLTPHAYAAAHKLARARADLAKGASVTRAMVDAGYSSSSRFHDASHGALGMEPRLVRQGGAGVTMRALVTACSLGRVLVAATERGVCSIAFGDDDDALNAELNERFPRATILPSDPALDALAAAVVQIVDGSQLADDLPLDLIGTAFQQRVWRALRAIPAGETRTYGELAAQLGSPGGARAVGSACGKNPIGVVVPCHRVIRDDGSLGGYRWGLPRKERLLTRERARR